MRFVSSSFSNFSWSRDNILCILTRQQTGRSRNRGWFTGSGKNFSSKVSRPGLRPTHLHSGWVPRVTSNLCRGQECVALHLHFLMCHDEGQSYGYRISLFLKLRQVVRLSVRPYILLHVFKFTISLCDKWPFRNSTMQFPSQSHTCHGNCITYRLPYLLTPWSRVLLEKLTSKL